MTPTTNMPAVDSIPAPSPGPSASASRDVLARVAEFAQFSPSASPTGGVSMDLLNDIPIKLTARLGQVDLTIGEILKMGPGALVALDRQATQPVDLVVGGRVFAKGEVVVVNDRFAVRVTELANTRLDAQT